MRKFSILVCAILVLGFSKGAQAYEFNMGPGSSVDISETNNALIMYANVNLYLDDEKFSLNAGETETHDFYFATIGTTEIWINDDDLNPGLMTAYVDFENPDLVQAIGGTSIGFSASFIFEGFIQGWKLTWNSPVVVDFAEGQFTIDLDDVSYSSFFWQGPDGSADVYAHISLSSTPVPEPSTLLLISSGLIGLVGFRRKFKKS